MGPSSGEMSLKEGDLNVTLPNIFQDYCRGLDVGFRRWGNLNQDVNTFLSHFLTLGKMVLNVFYFDGFRLIVPHLTDVFNYSLFNFKVGF